MTRVLITGGAGGFGRALTPRLSSHAALGYWLADSGPLLVLTLALLLVSAGWLDRDGRE